MRLVALLVLGVTATARAAPEQPPRIDLAPVSTDKPRPLGAVSAPAPAPISTTGLPSPQPTAVQIIVSPGGDKLITVGNSDDLEHPWVRAFDGKRWRLLGPAGQRVEDGEPAIALADDRLVVVLTPVAGEPPRLLVFDGTTGHVEKVPIDKRCVLVAGARDGADVLLVGHCPRHGVEVGVLVRRTPDRWIDEAVTSPPLHAIASGPAGIVAAGRDGTVVMREPEGWVVGSTGTQNWAAAAAGPRGTFLAATGELVVHELRGRVMTDVVLPVAVEPPGSHSACINDCEWPPSALEPEAVRAIVTIAGAGGPLAVLAAVPSSGDGVRRRTYGVFVWDGTLWRDAGRSTTTDNGDFFTRRAATHVIASERAVWSDDQRAITPLVP